jgi:HlyD family secretion protein
VRVPVSALRFRPRAGDYQKPEKKGGEEEPKREVAVFIAGADPYKPARRVVSLGLEGEEFAEVTSGLKGGERILVRSKSLLPKADSATADEDASDAEHPSP